jgi:hypothetical protein
VPAHADVLAATGPHHPLLGDAGRPVAEDWIDAGTASHGGHGYDVYHNGVHAQMLVDHAIARTFAG